MSVDTPARIAILGAGPIGLEAALYARFLGYDVDIYERGRVCEHLQRWGHQRMFTPFGQNRSPLGLAALRAQDDNWQPPADDFVPTGRELVEQYYLPLAQSDLLSDHLHLRTEVRAVGREWMLKHELPGGDDRAASDFRLLLASAHESSAETIEHVASADVVIDTTGVFGLPRWCGQGGIPAVGERQLQSKIQYGVPDVLGAEREHYAGRQTLVIGAGASAATSIMLLAQLAAQAPGTKVTWAVRHELNSSAEGPLRRLENDPLPARDQLFAAANALIVSRHAAIELLAGVTVGGIALHEAGYLVQLLGAAGGERQFDRIVANVGYRPDFSFIEELQFARCPATDRAVPRPVAADAQQGVAGGDQAVDLSPAVTELMLPEPDFYVLGAKSCGRNSDFRIQDGLTQIRDLFSLIGDRCDLDLYSHLGQSR